MAIGKEINLEVLAGIPAYFKVKIISDSIAKAETPTMPNLKNLSIIGCNCISKLNYRFN
jgi:hypothetical protein